MSDEKSWSNDSPIRTLILPLVMAFLEEICYKNEIQQDGHIIELFAKSPCSWALV
jgi:hypothetical protein